MKLSKIWHSGKGARLATAVAVVLSFVVSSAAKEKKQGAELLVQKKDGRIVKAELLAVKGRDLILMDFSSFSEMRVGIDDVRSIRIVKKSKLFKGLGLGFLIGGGSGAFISFMAAMENKSSEGWISFRPTAREYVLAITSLGVLGAAIGGGFGALAGTDEYVETEGKAPQEIEDILIKLDRKARFPQRQPQDTLKPGQTPEKSILHAGRRRWVESI